MSATLDRYRAKRRFADDRPDGTREPPGKAATPAAASALSFVVQKHAARRLHYDFRLEWDGVLKSWAVPKGPSLDPRDKRLAVEVEDHPLDYAGFEGRIPEGHYGAGTVEIWDRGHWQPEGDAARGLAEGKLDFTLHGERLHGRWTLVRTRDKGDKPSWLLFHRSDAPDKAADASAPRHDSPEPEPAPDAAPAATALPPTPPAELLAHACQLGLEGLIGKRADSPYLGRRSTDWVKLKCRQRARLPIVGYSAPKGARQNFGALLLGREMNGRLVYAGRVGSGFDAARLGDLKRQLDALATDSPPCENPPRAAGLHWVKPELFANVAFAEWTNDGLLRQAVYLGDDHETPAEAEERIAMRAIDPDTAGTRVAGIDITHPERRIDATSGSSKLDIARYYEAVAPWLLRELDGRPVAVLRAPDGIDGETFFQKHAHGSGFERLRQLDPALDPGHPPLFVIYSVAALIEAVQMGAIEFHPWNARADAIERPDRFILDLDPDPELPWRRMLDAARLAHDLLRDLGLACWLKTSGGKGLHIVVPHARRHDWDAVAGVAEAISRRMAETLPDRFSAKSGPKNRVGRIFVDYLRNKRGSTTAAAFGLRARPGLPVSMTLGWDQLDDLKSAAQWTIADAVNHLQHRGDDPWSGVERCRQTLTTARRRLGLD